MSRDQEGDAAFAVRRLIWRSTAVLSRRRRALAGGFEYLT
jgi:hypothetical protein